MAIVLVTGCNGGFGLATVRLLIERGHRVFATVLPSDPTGTAAVDALASIEPQLTVVPLDVTDDTVAELLIARIVGEVGRLDVLVNNAGVSMISAFEDVSIETTRRMFEVNYFGPVKLMLAALPIMRAQQAGRIVNVSSLAGLVPLPWLTTYVAAKHALAAVSLATEAEVRRFGIRISVIAPGAYATDIGKNLWASNRVSGEPHYTQRVERFYEDWKEQIVGTDPTDVARAIVSCIDGQNPPTTICVGPGVLEMVESRRQDDDAWAEKMAAFAYDGI